MKHLEVTMSKIKWTEKEVEYLLAHYSNTFTKDLERLLKKTSKQIYAKANLLKLNKSKEHQAEVIRITNISLRQGGKAHRFKKGIIPHNKGKKMPKDVYDKVAKTMFIKGNKPHNFKPVGSERITKDGYLERKIANPKTWRAVHLIVWETANGPIPDKHKVIFKDNNPLNTELSNLECITYAEAMLRNSIIRYPADLRFTMKTLKKLKTQIENGTKQN